jgi:hypothetical protein
MENLQHILRITPGALQGDGETQFKLPGTCARTSQRRTTMKS